MSDKRQRARVQGSWAKQLPKPAAPTGKLRVSLYISCCVSRMWLLTKSDHHSTNKVMSVCKQDYAKLPDGLLQNLEGCGMGQGRTHAMLVWIRLGFFVSFSDNLRGFC